MILLDDWSGARSLMVQDTDQVKAPPPARYDHSRPAKSRQPSPSPGGSGTISENGHAIRTGNIGRRRAGEGKAGRRVQLTDILNVNAQPESRPPFCQPRCERVRVEDLAARAGILGAARRARGGGGKGHPLAPRTRGGTSRRAKARARARARAGARGSGRATARGGPTQRRGRKNASGRGFASDRGG